MEKMIIYSHIFFVGETVLVIGKGPSGYDITEQLRNINISVILSSYKPVSLSKKILGK